MAGWFTTSLAFIYWMTAYGYPVVTVKHVSRHCLTARSKGGGGAKLLWAEARMAGDEHLDVKRTTGFDTRDMADLTMEKENKSTRLTLETPKLESEKDPAKITIRQELNLMCMVGWNPRSVASRRE